MADPPVTIEYKIAVALLGDSTTDEIRAKIRQELEARMTTPNYIAHITDVASELHPASILTRVMDSWDLFERDAKVFYVPYDILHTDFSAWRGMETLVRLLYDTRTGTVASDTEELKAKHAAYGGSWCERGGPGAFFTVVRKVDRLKSMIKKVGTTDIEEIRAKADVGGETLADTLGDLRRYLILCLAYRRAQDQPEAASG